MSSTCLSSGIFWKCRQSGTTAFSTLHLFFFIIFASFVCTLFVLGFYVFFCFPSAGLLRRVGANKDPPAVELLGYLIFLKRLGTLEKRKSGRLSGISVELLGQIPA